MQPFLVIWNGLKQLTTSTTHLDQELPTGVQRSGGSRSFAEETRVLKMRSIVASHWKLTKQSTGSSELILLQLHEKRLKNSASAIQQSLDIWSKLERWKSSISGCLMSWPQIKNIVFSYSTQKQLTISRLDCDMLHEWILCDNQRWQAQSLNQEEAPKHFPKPACTKKGHGHRVLVCCPSDPLQLSESQRNRYIRDVCSANRQDAPKPHTCASIAQQKGPDSSWQHSTAHRTTRFKSWANWAQVLPHPSHSPDLSPTNNHAFKHLNNFLQGITLQKPGGGRKCFLRVHWIRKHGFLCYRNKQTYFSLTKTCW